MTEAQLSLADHDQGVTVFGSASAQEECNMGR